MSDYKNILAIDSTLNGFSIGLCSPDLDQVITVQTEMERGQAEHLVPAIQTTMKEANIAFADLEALLVTYGPGAFAGLRIGLSTMRAISVSLDIPIYGLSTFEAIAFSYQASHKPAEPFCVVLETKRDDFYAQIFDQNLKPLTDPVAAPSAVIKSHIIEHEIHMLAGNACERLLDAESDIKAQIIPIMLSDMAVCADIFLKSPDNPVFMIDPSPLYLRGADVSKSKKSYRKLEETVFM